MLTGPDAEARCKLALDILSDMISKHLAKQASPELREATLAIMEKETEEQLDFEMTSELLVTTDFRVRSVA
ncbi:hypothetical protein ACFPVX_17405 [Cohnella faecalis]|uniref:Uncharacterized protein n=1 Tax=Cohnella faecalis TaxID=2315694 RepID=A0A398CHN5_9BACL|nr:hypothetical protein D3H35_24470 [Cohnella faecalis]